ncbi:MAG: hypothetical protein IH958_05155 [Chloroflexi bacterium]|nr:hypothetical protein [Chloroflexota bacterium]
MNLLLLLGTMFVPVGVTAYVVGFMMHGMMSVGFGLIHGAILAGIDVDSVGAGIGLGVLFGLVHAMITGMMLGMMPLMHPRLKASRPKLVLAMVGGTPGPDEELLDPPGFFALSYPPLTAMGFVMLHLMYGAIVGGVYAAFA